MLEFYPTARTLYSTRVEYTFFSSTHEIFSRREQMLGHKANLNKLKRSEIIQSMLTDKNGMKSAISNREIWKFQKYVEINILLNH